jgi:ABC-type Fe3+-hydroxamate transport system substrate-binding protein
VFLLQNWWKTKPFVEVSAEYLALCKADIIFITKKPDVIPTGLPVAHSRAYEFFDGGSSKWPPQK